ncbi:MAG: DUF1987 domain-containing protein [Cytophagales bacterium]
MEKLILEPKNKTPRLDFDHITGKMVVTGVSSAENSLEFYRPILAWIEDYKLSPHTDTTVDINYKYFNTSSAKCILDMLERFVQLKSAKTNLVINWYYEKDDEEMYDAGVNFSDILETTFNLIEVE